MLAYAFREIERHGRHGSPGETWDRTIIKKGARNFGLEPCYCGTPALVCLALTLL